MEAKTRGCKYCVLVEFFFSVTRVSALSFFTYSFIN